MPPTSDRSFAINQLYEAVRIRVLANDATIREKEQLDKKVYDACVECYKAKISKALVEQTIKAVSCEFFVAVK